MNMRNKAVKTEFQTAGSPAVLAAEEEAQTRWAEDLSQEIRKDIEHGTRKELTGSEIDKLLNEADKYLKSIKKLFASIEIKREKDDVASIYESIVTVIRDILRFENVEKVPEHELAKIFNDELVAPGKVPARFKRLLDQVIKAKKDYEQQSAAEQESSTPLLSHTFPASGCRSRR